MGFSLNSLEAEELKRALQRDSSVSEITLNQNHAFNLTNCSRVLEYYKSETAFNIKIWCYCLFSWIGKTIRFFDLAGLTEFHDLWQYTRPENRGARGWMEGC